MTYMPAKRTGGIRVPRQLAALGLLLLLGLVAAACGVQESNAYPVEIFSEMHYSQASRAQEPPRLQPPAESVVFEPNGGPEVQLNVPESRRRPYDPTVAGNLYRVNCSVCHGVNGLGDGRAAPHIVSNQSYYATDVSGGSGYNGPPNLQESRTRLTDQQVFAIVSNGIIVMPSFGDLLTEEDIWDIVAYVVDTQNGLGTAP